MKMNKCRGVKSRGNVYITGEGEMQENNNESLVNTVIYISVSLNSKLMIKSKSMNMNVSDCKIF